MDVDLEDPILFFVQFRHTRHTDSPQQFLAELAKSSASYVSGSPMGSQIPVRCMDRGSNPITVRFSQLAVYGSLKDPS